MEKVLTHREYYAISDRYGLINDINKDANPKIQKQIANELGNLTMERVRKIETRALKKLNNYFLKK